MQEKIRTAWILGLRFLFFTRYSWLLALALVALPPFALAGAPALLENLFVLDRAMQMFNVSWITMFCAVSVFGTLRITTLNADDRFEDYRAACDEFQLAWRAVDRDESPWYRRWEGGLTLVLGLAAAIGLWYVVVSACVARTVQDPGPGWHDSFGTEPTHAAVAGMAWWQALLGAAATLGTLGFVNLLLIVQQKWLSAQIVDDRPYQPCLGTREANNLAQPEDHLPEYERGLFHWLAWYLGPGYFREVTFRRDEQLVRQIVLAPGHGALIASTTLFLGWYGWNYGSGLGQGSMSDESSAMPALFFGLLSLLLVILVLPGVAFLLDRHRVPILPTLLLVMAAFYGVFGTDHFYELNPSPMPATSPSPPDSVDAALAKWKIPPGRDGLRTLVVVDASGGGIQASAWTAQVLTGLHELYGDEFSRSMGLISSVSGGSVGSMFYLAHRAESDEHFSTKAHETVLTSDAIAQIREAARASGLEATCWGIAYPDTMRAVFPPLAGKLVDRGWSIEQVWRAHMERAGPRFGDLRLPDLADRVSRNQLPIAAFNATVVETGQRLILSPLFAPPTVGKSSAGGWEFIRAFPESRLCVSTAARLSATFPYVTPVSRPMNANGLMPTGPLAFSHVADGAYVDNEGVVTSVDWINRLLIQDARNGQAANRSFDRILLVRIQAFPKEIQAVTATTGSLAGWRAALLGPFDAMMHVRSASQTERGDLEIGLLTRATLAEMQAARERSAREFQSALAQVDQLESIHGELRRLAEITRSTSAEIGREFSEVQDKLRIAQEMLRDAQDRRRQLNDLIVESVVFDFHPVDQVRIPMSWKLTTRQKQQIDHAWSKLVAGDYPHQPLEVLDRYFERR